VPSDDRGRVLLALARRAIELELVRGEAGAARLDAAWLADPGASFVTLHCHGELRGCIGTLRAYRPLGEDVRANAVGAAFADPRFPPIGRGELPGLSVEVSVVSPLVALAVGSEDELRAALRPGRDGLLIELGGLRATFLPQVWEHLPEPGLFLRALKQKAGLPEGFWSQEVRVWRYAVGKHREGEAG
jgi:AmmeMemoRadiSam system protein A